jgi:ABC-2 type transport system ATP-binding protein
MTEPPIIDAGDLGVRTHRGWIFKGVSFRAGAAQLVAIAGPGGSGRSSLLLTLSGRMRASAGALRVCGLPLPDKASQVRSRTAVARIGGAVVLDDELRVRDHVRERALAAGCSKAAFGKACSAIGANLDERALIGSLDPHQVTLLSLALALMEGRRVVLLDDLDSGSDSRAQGWLWAAARRAADSGVCVIATTTDGNPASPYAHHVASLPAPRLHGELS